MPRLKSSKEVIKILEKLGFEFVSQRGSHTKYFNGSKNLTVIVPANKKEIPMGTFNSIVRQSGTKKEDFE